MQIYKQLTKIKPSATLAINEKSAELVERGRTVYRFGFGQSPFPVPKCIVEELKTYAHEKGYLPVLGLYELREAVAQYHREQDHLDVSAEQVIIGPGSKELMFDLLLSNKWHVLIPSPAWVSYEPQSILTELPFSRINCTFEERWRVTPENLEQAIKDADSDQDFLLIINYPGNPDGLVYSPEELDALAQVCRKYHVTVLSDEIYGRLHHGNDHHSIYQYYPERTFITSGLSKWCGAGGWRLGTMVVPKDLFKIRDIIAGIASETFSCVSSPVQFAAIKAFQYDADVENYVVHCQRILKVIGDYCYDAFNKAQIRIHPNEGGFYMFVDLMNFQEKLNAKGITDSPTLFDTILEETGVALLPGTDFGLPADYFVARFAYVDFDGGAAIAKSREIGLEQDLPDTFVSDVASHLMEGVQKLCTWLDQL